jgi:LacI family transcriptional regulator
MARNPGLTAIFALNDVMAIGVMAALRDELKLSVPEDVSVVGFDDISLTVDVQPPLSTVHLPLEEIGRHGMRLLLDEAPAGVRTVRVPAALVRRGSSAPPRD